MVGMPRWIMPCASSRGSATAVSGGPALAVPAYRTSIAPGCRAAAWGGAGLFVTTQYPRTSRSACWSPCSGWAWVCGRWPIPQSAISSSCAAPGNDLQRAHECALAQFPFEGCGRGSAPASAAREALTGTSKSDRLPVDGVLTGAGTEIGRGAPLGDCAGKDFPSEDESGSPGRVLPARMLWSRMGDRLNIRFRRSAESTWGVSWPSAPFCIPAAIDRFAEQMGTDHDV